MSEQINDQVGGPETEAQKKDKVTKNHAEALKLLQH